MQNEPMERTRRTNTPASAGVGLLNRSIAILRVLATAGRKGMALTSIARAVGLPNSTIHRLLGQLISERLAMRIEGATHYALGPLAYELGLAAALQFDIRALCRPVIEQLALDAEETVYLNMRSGDEAVCIDLVEGPSPVRIIPLTVGSRRPLGLGAGGLAILSALPLEEQSSICVLVGARLERDWGLPEEQMRQSLQEARQNGYSLIRNRVQLGVSAIACPVRDSLGQVLGAVGIGARNARMDRRHLQRLIPLLRQAGQDISLALRGNHWVRYVQAA